MLLNFPSPLLIHYLEHRSIIAAEDTCSETWRSEKEKWFSIDGWDEESPLIQAAYFQLFQWCGINTKSFNTASCLGRSRLSTSWTQARILCCYPCRKYNPYCVFPLTGFEKCSEDTMKGSHDLALVVSTRCWGTWCGTLRIMIRDVGILRDEKMMVQLNVWITKVCKHCKTRTINNLF